MGKSRHNEAQRLRSLEDSRTRASRGGPTPGIIHDHP